MYDVTDHKASINCLFFLQHVTYLTSCLLKLLQQVGNSNGINHFVVNHHYLHTLIRIYSVDFEVWSKLAKRVPIKRIA